MANDDRLDPSGSTEAFRAFVQTSNDLASIPRSAGRWVLLGLLLALLVVVAVTWLVLAS